MITIMILIAFLIGILTGTTVTLWLRPKPPTVGEMIRALIVAMNQTVEPAKLFSGPVLEREAPKPVVTEPALQLEEIDFPAQVPGPHEVLWVSRYGTEKVRYRGSDKSKAIDAWMELESNEAMYPGYHIFWDGQVRPRAFHNTYDPKTTWEDYRFKGVQ